MELRTKRLLLRPIASMDAQALFSYRSDAVTNQYQGWIPKTIQDAEEFIGKVNPNINVPDSWFQLVIIENDNQQIIGDVGIHFIDEHQVEIGCTLCKHHQGKGYAKEAFQSIFDYLFNELGKHRVIGSIDPKNTASLSLLERLGFRKEAHFKESILVNGLWVDDVIYALLKKDWTKQ